MKHHQATEPLTAKALRHVQRNPGSQARTVASALGISANHAANILLSLERRGLIESQSIYASGTGYRRRFYPCDATGQARSVTARAERIGGPFGIAAAQVMT